MNVCYSMRKTDPLLALFAILVLASQAFSDPVDPETTNEEPILPPEPLSKIVYVNDLLPGETVNFDFAFGASVYVSSSKDKEARDYEENIHILRPDVDGEFKKMNEVGDRVNIETGEKKPIFESLLNRIAIRNNNLEKSNLKNPGIIYFLMANDETHVSNVYETSRYEKRVIFIQSDSMDSHYVTLLNPTGAARISGIHFIEGLTALTVTAGGLEETKSTNFTIHDIGKDAAKTEATLFFVEPVLTIRKQLAIFPGSSFQITAKGEEVPSTVVIPMKWSDWSLGMSPNYMLRNVSTSFKYIFNATEQDSQFDIQMFGEISSESSLKVSYDGLEGTGSESFEKRQLERVTKSMKAQTVTVEYQRGKSDVTKGVLVRVECSQPAAKLLIYPAFFIIFLLHFVLYFN